jgi:hypothetical protein
MKEEPVYAKKEVVRPYRWASCTLMVIGGAIIIGAVMMSSGIGFAMGCVTVGVGCALDRKQHVCAGCGNAVLKTSKHCPTCGAHFAFA